MKVVKGLFLFAVSTVVTACFDPPEFSDTPQIDFLSVSFKEGNVNAPTDSLIVTISFRDGDGDLGLAGDQIEEPYNDIFYGLASNGEIIQLGKKTEFTDLPQFVDVPPGMTGKLATVRTLADPAYSDNLPPFVDAVSSCTDYKLQSVYVMDADKQVIDASYAEIDTMKSKNGFPPIYIVKDMFYFQNNPNHRNIEVEFWENDGTGKYTLFDWEKEYCEAAFNQRFPVLTEKPGPLEGNLTYALTSVGIKATFGSKSLRLKIRIRDRALNVSNDVQTEDFTLDKIKK
ncbi:hypothetical protein WBG78_06630 [Chryseolinea sp. T2]|uniref:hypothetical protein n=1 Tax=Chryseolinea sp. T2 TaxID=3129255 RepID=UPI0030774640